VTLPIVLNRCHYHHWDRLDLPVVDIEHPFMQLVGCFGGEPYFASQARVDYIQTVYELGRCIRFLAQYQDVIVAEELRVADREPCVRESFECSQLDEQLCRSRVRMVQEPLRRDRG
jgi:hypothetical protein